jgi:hypothetical protein
MKSLRGKGKGKHEVIDKEYQRMDGLEQYTEKYRLHMKLLVVSLK